MEITALAANSTTAIAASASALGGGGFAYAPGYDDYGYDGACYQYREVYTTAGWQWRQLWVCN